MNSRDFATPAVEYRPIPFWSLNDELEPSRLRKQIAAFASAGMGGFFMHPRPGMKTAFLSNDWFDAVSTSIQAAEELGIKAWIYDESSYPSGFAGGLVPAKRPDLAQKWIAARPVTSIEKGEATGEHVLGLFAIDGKNYWTVRAGQQVSAGESLLLINMQTHSGSAWLNGGPYVDLLNPAAAETFLEVGYEPYAKRFGDQLGTVIPGVFTDEPNIRPSGSRDCLPWTPGLEEIFAQRYGASLLERLPELFNEVGDYAVTRYRYWRLVTELFMSSWLQPIYEWCEANNLQFTGHLWEHAFSPTNSGSLMAPMQYMHIPGIDLLGRDVTNARLPQDSASPEQMGNVIMVKAVTSVAHQLDRPQVLSETYGGGGWEMPLETQKRYAEWEYALGINLLNQHLSHYSLRGFRKQDYPISFMDYQPWWPWYRVLGDYFARLSYALRQGRYQAEILILHPMTSLWTEWGPGSQNSTGRVMELSLNNLLKAVSAANFGCDFGDELVMEEQSNILQSDDGKPVIQVGAMQYQVLVIPSCINLSAQTLSLVQEFIASGGKCILVPPVPKRIDGALTDLGDALAQCEVANSPDELVDFLNAAAAEGLLQRAVRTATSSPSAPLYSLVRETDLGDVVFLANMGDTPHINERVWLRGLGPVERWDLATGAIESLPTSPVGEGVEVRLDFAETESHLLVHRNSAEEDKVEANAPASQPNVPVAVTSKLGRHLPSQVRTSRALSNSWAFRRSAPNVLRLDRPSYKVGDGAWSERVFTEQVAHELRLRYGLKEHPIRDQQPWVKYPDGATEYPEQVTMRYSVQCNMPVPEELWLVVEDAAAFAISVNGKPVQEGTGDATTADQYWLDPAFRRIPVRHEWREGENIVELTFRFSEDLPVEAAFLLGDFALSSSDGCEYAMEPEQGAILAGSWVSQGYPFFVGKAIYTHEVEISEDDLSEGVWLELGRLPNVIEVRCNGKSAGVVAWRPYRCELTSLLHAGRNILELEVANSLHNALGPLHAAELPVIVGPEQYSYSAAWVPEYRLVPDGIAKSIRLLIC